MTNAEEVTYSFLLRTKWNVARHDAQIIAGLNRLIIFSLMFVYQ